MSIVPKLECETCGNTTSLFFIQIGNVSLCLSCGKKKNKVAIVNKQKPREFYKYICITHNCSTYSIMNMNRHEMNDCEIESVITLGVEKPKTTGGHNGDIGRIWFLGINEIDRLMHQLGNYRKFVLIRNKLKYQKTFDNQGKRKNVWVQDLKYYTKHKGFLVRDVRIKVDNLKIDTLNAKIRKYSDYQFPQKRDVGKSDFYTTMMNNFKKQQKEKSINA